MIHWRVQPIRPELESRPTGFALWLSETATGSVETRVLGSVSQEYLEGFFAGIENAEAYGPISVEDVRSLRKAIYQSTGVRV